jgi:hypothetical protein
MLRRAGLVLAIHTLLVVGVGLAVLTAIRSSPMEENELLWNVFDRLDFPVSLCFDAFEKLVDPPIPANREWKGVFVPVIVYGLAGGAQYFLLAIVFLYVWEWRRPRDRTHCTKCGYDLRGLREPRCPECGWPFDLRRVESEDDE